MDGEGAPPGGPGAQTGEMRVHEKYSTLPAEDRSVHIINICAIEDIGYLPSEGTVSVGGRAAGGPRTCAAPGTEARGARGVRGAHPPNARPRRAPGPLAAASPVPRLGPRRGTPFTRMRQNSRLGLGGASPPTVAASTTHHVATLRRQPRPSGVPPSGVFLTYPGLGEGAGRGPRHGSPQQPGQVGAGRWRPLPAGPWPLRAFAPSPSGSRAACAGAKRATWLGTPLPVPATPSTLSGARPRGHRDSWRTEFICRSVGGLA